MVFKKIHSHHIACSQSALFVALISSSVFCATSSLYAQEKDSHIDVSQHSEQQAAVLPLSLLSSESETLHTHILDEETLSHRHEGYLLSDRGARFHVPVFLISPENLQQQVFIDLFREKLPSTTCTYMHGGNAGEYLGQLFHHVPTLPMQGFTCNLEFQGNEASSGMALLNTQEEKGHAAIHAAGGVAFSNMNQGLFFGGWASSNFGGACCAGNVYFIDNKNVSFSRCSTTKARHKDILWEGGGAIATTMSDALNGENPMKGGVFLTKNKAVRFHENHADVACGGAIACQQFVCFDNDKVSFSNNQAEFGGAIAAKESIVFSGNQDGVQFTKNRAVLKKEKKEEGAGDNSGQNDSTNGSSSQNESKAPSPQSGDGQKPSDNQGSSETSPPTTLAPQTDKPKAKPLSSREALAFSEHPRIDGQLDGPIEYVGGGALFSLEDVVFDHNADVVFKSNESQASGGAIASKTLKISETLFRGKSASQDKKEQEDDKRIVCFTFLKNKALDKGGAVYTQHLQIVDNTGAIAFVENESGSGRGGAVYCGSQEYSQEPSSDLGVIDIQRNHSMVSFSNNWATGKCDDFVGGGALWGSEVRVCENDGNVAFYANCVRLHEGEGSFIGGGAVLAKDSITIAKNTAVVNITDNNMCSVRMGEREDLQHDLHTEGKSLVGGGALLSRQINICENSGLVNCSKNLMRFKHEDTSLEGMFGGGGVLGVDYVHVEGNASVCFQDNFADGENVCGGAMLSKDIRIVNNGLVNFTTNSSTLFGGAVCALETDLMVTGNSGGLVFSKNKTTTAGGGLASVAARVMLTDNQGDVAFQDNSAVGERLENESLEEGQINTNGFRSGGGAIFAKKGIRIANNGGSITFAGNRAGCYGGAILTGSLDPEDAEEQLADKVRDVSSTYVEIVDNGSEVLFANNATFSVKHPDHNLFGGGAIHTTNLTIAGNRGAVTFRDNKAATGGAVRIADHGKVVLSAHGGDIVFRNNKNAQGESDGIYFSGSSSWIDSLSATQGTSVQFHDALTFEDLTLRRDEQGSLKILALNGEHPEHKGEISFHSATSKVPQFVYLKQGTLAVKDQGHLWLGGFKQEIGSQLLLGAGSSLRVSDFDHVQENRKPSSVHSVHVDMSSFADEQGNLLSSPELIFPEGEGVGEHGLDVYLVDLSGTGYENHALLGQERTLTFVSLYKTSKDGVVSPVELPLSQLRVHTPEITDQTFGHIGTWSLDDSSQGAVFKWVPEGYRLNPEKNGAIVCNSLWAAGNDLRLVKEQQLNHQQTTQRMDFDYSMNLCVSGLGAVVHCDSKDQIDGFSQKSAGLGIALDAHPFDDFLVGAGLYQLYGDMTSKEYDAKNDRQSIVGYGYGVISSGSWLFKMGGAYSNTHNHLKTNYRVLGESEGSWDMRSFLWDVQTDYRYVVNPHSPIASVISTVVPFVEFEYIQVTSSAFTETGKEIRRFDEGTLRTYTVPFGVSLENCYAKGQKSEVNSLSVSYLVDVYRTLPDMTVALSNINSWKGVGVEPASYALKVQFCNNTEWSSYFSTFLSGSYTMREQMHEYNVHTGARLIF